MKAQTLGRVMAAVFVFGLASAKAAPVLAADECASSEASLDVTVEGLRNGNGLITYTLYPDDRKRFLAKGGSLARIRVDAHYPATETCIPLPRPGAYALAVYHDEDGDRKLDRNVIGLPKEGFAFSNNAPAAIGLPSFDAARFVAKAGKTVMRIKLRYLSGKEKIPPSAKAP